MKAKKTYWIATKKGELPRVAKYASLLPPSKYGWKHFEGPLPKKYVYMTVK